jgi:hypothetical protein
MSSSGQSSSVGWTASSDQTMTRSIATTDSPNSGPRGHGGSVNPTSLRGRLSSPGESSESSIARKSPRLSSAGPYNRPPRSSVPALTSQGETQGTAPQRAPSLPRILGPNEPVQQDSTNRTCDDAQSARSGRRDLGPLNGNDSIMEDSPDSSYVHV